MYSVILQILMSSHLTERERETLIGGGKGTEEMQRETGYLYIV